MLKLTLFGMPAICLHDKPVILKTSKSQALLYYLAINANFHSRDLLADLFWPNMQTQQARKNLRDALSHLRAELSDYLLVDRQKLAFNAAMPHDNDVHAFIHKIEQGRLTQDCALVEAGLAYYQAEFLVGLHLLDAAPFDGWQSRQRQLYARYALDAMTWLATTYLTMQKYEEGISVARRILVLEPWQENIHRLLMELFVYAGNQSAAVHQYELCRQQLAGTMGIVPSLETEQLYSQIRQGTLRAVDAHITLPSPDRSAPLSVAMPALPRTNTRVLPHNLPARHAPLVGRDEAVTQLQDLLLASTYPLVSLIGQGGIGKSCLALAVAQRLIAPTQNADAGATDAAPLGLSTFPDGIWFVDLSALSEQEQNPKQMVEAIASAIADTLKIPLTVETPLHRQLGLALRHKAALLILDNFEQHATVANYLVELLQMTQSLQLLITSRQRLVLSAEYVFTVNSLAFPPLAPEPPAAQPGLQQLLGYSAIQLFCEHAQRVQPAFRLTEANWAAVVRLCQLLDGLPLAIKLATSLLNLYSCQQLAEQLTQDYRLLSSHSPDLPARQRSMYTVIEASWRRLAADEALILAGCTRLQGAVDLAAIQATTGATIAQVRKLIHRSLLHHNPTNQHFSLHQLIRQYGAEQLARHPKLAQQVNERHAAYFLQGLEQCQSGLLADPMQCQQIKDYWENIITAWQWSVNAGRLELVEKSAQALAHLYRRNNRLHEAIALFVPAIILARQQAALSGDPAKQRTLAHLLSCSSEFHQLLGQTATAGKVAHELMALGKTLDDLLFQAKALKDLAIVAKMNGDYHAMYSYGLKGVSLLQALELMARSGTTNHSLQQAAAVSDLITLAEIETAAGCGSLVIERYRAQGVALLQEKGSALWLRVTCLASVATAGVVLALFDESMASGQLALTCLQQEPNRDLEAEVNLSLGVNCQHRQEYMSALHYLTSAVALSRTQQNHRLQAQAQCYLGDLFCKLGDYAKAEALYAEIFTLDQGDTQPLWQNQLDTSYGHWLYLQGKLTTARSYYQWIVTQSSQIQSQPEHVRTLLYLGELLTESGEWAAAAATYQKLKNLQIASAWPYGHADWHAGMAMLYAAQQQWAAAHAHTQQALATLSTKGIAVCEDPFVVYQRAIFVLSAVADPATETVIAAAQALVASQAATIPDPQLRHSFLTKVAAIRAIVAGAPKKFSVPTLVGSGQNLDAPYHLTNFQAE